MDQDEVRKGDVEKQLEKILAGKLFRGSDRSDLSGKLKPASPRSAELLRYLVEEKLADRETDEATIQTNHYGRQMFNENDTIVRANIFQLRKKLAEYYVTDGINDPVSIEILSGYKVTFKYRSVASPDKELARGFYHINLEAPDSITKALGHFEKSIEQGGAAEAFAGKAMALSTLTLHEITASPVELLPRAKEAAQEALKLDPNSWRAHAALGGIYAFQREWGLADQEFRKALAISSVDTFDHGAYGLYLLGIGDYKGGKEVARHDEKMHPGDVIFLKRSALYLYAMREFGEAERILDELSAMEKRLWHAHHLRALSCLATNRPEKALFHVRQMLEQGDARLWPGLHILCLQENGLSDEARSRFDDLLAASGTGYVQPLQLALGYIAMGDPLLAIEWLGEGAKQRDPHMLWLHLWPFLDPLREDTRFKDLLRRFSPPKTT